MPFFSIVMPVYNKRPHVHRSISSVLAQTFTNYELLVIDDASTDGSIEEVRRFSDPRIRVLRRAAPGPGGYAARNLGIREARGPWIAFLDADDEWLSTHLEKMYQLHQQFPDIGMLGAGWEVEEKGQRAIDGYSARYMHTGSHSVDFMEYLVRDNSSGKPFYTSTVCVVKEVILRAGGFPEKTAKRGGDIDTWFRIMLTHGKCAWSAHIGAVYHRDSINMVSRKWTYETPSICKSIAMVLKRRDLSLQQRRLLKLNSNLNAHSTIKLAMLAGQLSAVHLKHYYFLASPTRFIAFWAIMGYQTVCRFAEENLYRLRQTALEALRRIRL